MRLPTMTYPDNAFNGHTRGGTVVEHIPYAHLSHETPGQNHSRDRRQLRHVALNKMG
jgi:hypothetical protein